jgi:catechol 2,3-dioxygenase-like lactoylglutathione lyase family enzyme
MQAKSILETSLYVNDLDAAEEFYANVIGLQLHAKEPGRHVFFRCGDAMFLLFDPKTTATFNPNFPKMGPHGSVGPGHAAFRCEEAELDDWRSHLSSHGIEIESEITWPNGGFSIYFRDPAGNSLELATPALWGLD